MANLKNNINIGWYGNCGECRDIDIYTEEGDLNDSFANLELVLQVSETGFKYSSWTAKQHEKQVKIWNSLSTNVKQSLSYKTFIQSGQVITKFVCGTPYIVEIKESTNVELEHFTIINSHSSDARVVECFECPKFSPCICE